MIDALKIEAVSLVKQLVSIPSLSREEDETAYLLFSILHQKGFNPKRQNNNVWAINKFFDEKKPTLLLQGHHDSVPANAQWTRDAYDAGNDIAIIYGLGSNDAGGALATLLTTFFYFYEREDLKFNIIFAACGEEEISGTNGISSLLPSLGEIDLAIVGEPTEMNIAVAEKGLIVLDVTCIGKAGHAAREEGINAIYLAMESIEWFRSFQFPKVSETLGPVKMSVTQIQAGSKHNVVPETCSFVVDVRTTDAYSNEETLAIIKENVLASVIPRSLRLQSSGIDANHALLKAAKEMGRKFYGSPTLSDQALMPFPSIKMGPGKSERSHTADELIYTKEIEEAVELYIELIEKYNTI